MTGANESRPRVLFLVSPTSDGARHNDNHTVLPEAFTAADWQVTVARHDQICLRDGELICNGRAMLDFQLIWPVGFGPRTTYLDRSQLLALLPQTRLITPVQALASLEEDLRGRQQALDGEASRANELEAQLGALRGEHAAQVARLEQERDAARQEAAALAQLQQEVDDPSSWVFSLPWA